MTNHNVLYMLNLKHILFICLGVVYNVGGVLTYRKTVTSVAFYPLDSRSYAPNINNVYVLDQHAVDQRLNIKFLYSVISE